MSNMSRAAIKCGRLIGAVRMNRNLPCTSFNTFRLLSTEASEPSLGDLDESTGVPSSGLVYGRLLNITKYTTKTDILNLLEDSNLNPENIRVEYDRSFLPFSMVVEFPSKGAYDDGIRAISRKGRLFNMQRIDRSRWDLIYPYDGKAILLQGIPRTALPEDVERFLSGCQYDSSSLQMAMSPGSQGAIKMAIVRFPSQPLAMHAYITKNRGFCLNNQITMRILH